MSKQANNGCRVAGVTLDGFEWDCTNPYFALYEDVQIWTPISPIISITTTSIPTATPTSIITITNSQGSSSFELLQGPLNGCWVTFVEGEVVIYAGGAFSASSTTQAQALEQCFGLCNQVDQ